MPVDTLTTFQAAQRVMADVTGMKAVHGVTPPTSGSGANAILRPATDLLADSPAIVIGSGPIEIDFESHGRLRIVWTLSCAVWRVREATALDAAYDALVGDVGRVAVAIAARGKAYAIDTGIQLLWPRSFGAIDGAEWPVGSNAWWVYLPFECPIVADYYDVAMTPA